MKTKNIIAAVVAVLMFGFFLWLVLTIRWANRYISFDKQVDTDSWVNQKIYVANEWESTVTVIDATTNTIINTINLSQQYYGKFLSYSAHNVQVWPKWTVVLVTANIAEDKEEWHSAGEVNKDELTIIDPITDTIVWRIGLDKWAHLAHVVVTSDDTLAYATSQDKWKVYVIDLQTKERKATIMLPEWSQPHWIRLSPDGKYLYVALIGERWIARVDILDLWVKIIPLNWKVVQVAVTPDNKYVFASLYNTKSIARYDISTEEVEVLNLPDWALWPVQVYPSPDSAFIYVADQWYYFDEPISNSIYKIDVNTLSVVEKYTGWKAPHGVVVSPDWEKTYVTNLLSNDVTVINNKENKVESTIAVGKMPNGISIRTRWIGWTP
jgi:YVTN family beta-propeller protein